MGWAFALIIGGAGLISHAVAAAQIDPLTCDGETALRLNLPVAPERLSLVWTRAPGRAAVLEVRELGQDIVIDDPSETITVPVPPRLGVSLVPVEGPIRIDLARLRAGTAPAALELRLHCQEERSSAERRWFQTAAALLPSLGGGPGSLRDAYPDAILAALDDAVHDDRSRALTRHLHAQVQLLAGRSDEAAETFAVAAELWQRAGDSERFSAAQVGIAEDLNRAGRYEEALAVTRGPGLPEGGHYFGARLENARCLALHYLGRLEQASACYAWTSERLDALAEVLELASTGINFAAVEMALGRSESAHRILLASVELARGPQARVVEGRARLALAALAHRQANLSEALSQLNHAVAVFAEAGEPRWQSIALTTLAPWLADLGASGDARAANTQARAMLDPGRAPARMAAADLLAARIDLLDHQPHAALAHAERAQAAYASLNMPRESALASLQLAEALIRVGRHDAAAQALAEVEHLVETAPQDTVAQRHRLIGAELALARGDTASAARSLAIVPDTLSWHRRIDHDRLTALLHWRTGDSAAAFEHVQARRRTYQQLASGAGNALVGHGIRQAMAPLAELVVDLVARDWRDGRLTAQQATDRLLPWLIDDDARHGGHQPAADDGPALDIALGRLLSPGSEAEKNRPSGHAQLTGLLARLAGGEPQRATDNVPVPTRFTLDRPWMALARGRDHGLRLWVMPGQPPRLHAFDPAALADPLDALRAALAQPGADLATLDRHAQALSALLLAELPLATAPAHLTVLADPISRTIPWPMLTWPGSDQPLVDTTAITLMTPVERLGPQASTTPSLNVLIAAQNRVGQADVNPNPSAARLPTLTGALREPALIAEAMTPRPIITRTLEDRSDTLDALAEPGAWLHLSAHGQTRSDRLLASGIWLEPSKPGQPPDFFGWADALERGVGAELIVLNACQLAESSSAATAALDFASAISRAGARHTIAAQWPVSDTASAVWVPAFYRSLTRTTTPDPAQALAEARRALRASRAFRHPFHWAGWVHLERVAVDRSVP